MKNYRNYLTFRGGGYVDIPAAEVKNRVERFVKKTKACSPQSLKEPWKGLIIYTLVEFFEWEFKDAAEYLDVTVKTAKTKVEEAKRMYSLASLTSKLTSNGSKFVFDLRDYIKYNIYRK